MLSSDTYDVAVIGGGPAGSVMAWSLAKRGVRVAVVERAIFPREKVCGDFVEPGGLRILQSMGCLPAIEASSPMPIDKTQIFLRSQVVYRGPIPYYEEEHDLRPYGFIVPRHELDTHLLECARSASANVFENCLATGIDRDGAAFRVGVRNGGTDSSLRARMVVGADGTQSIVAKTFGLLRNDRRYISVSQRGYVEDISVEDGEAAIVFDDDIYPGYGWMFPMAGGRANIGIGILSEACDRYRLSVRDAFQSFQQKLREQHPGCTRMRVVGKPLGGIVKTYGGAGPNYFDGGVLIGDAGSFVDPVTGEGITPAMESALIASETVAAALEHGQLDAAYLSRFERDFRRYFDPAMCYLDLCASVLRNTHFRDFWLSSMKRAFEQAASDPNFARVAGSSFGGLRLEPLPIMTQIWFAALRDVASGIGKMSSSLLSGKPGLPSGWMTDLITWQQGLRDSLLHDPLWHLGWTRDVMTKWMHLQTKLWTPANPRVQGLVDNAEAGTSTEATT